MAFFPTYKDNWTRTPNVFFDEILRNPKANLNQIRLVGYLIRKTIGYNQDSKWVGVSRTDLINKAGIPNSRIKDAIESSVKNGWILIFEEGKGTRKKRYIFLNDERNQKIVAGLNQKLFKIADLEYLNLAGIDKLLENNEIATTTETGEELMFPTTETGEVTTTETGEVTTTETGEVDNPQSQQLQEVSSPLNTYIKYNNKYNNNSDVVVVKNHLKKELGQSVNDRIVKQIMSTLTEYGKSIDEGIALLQDIIDKYMKEFNYSLSIKEAHSLLYALLENDRDFEELLQGTINYFAQKQQPIHNPVGCLLNAINKGFQFVPTVDRKQEPKRYGSVEETKKLLEMYQWGE